MPSTPFTEMKVAISVSSRWNCRSEKCFDVILKLPRTRLVASLFRGLAVFVKRHK